MYIDQKQNTNGKEKNEDMVDRPSVDLDYSKTRKAALVLRALNHKLRQQMLEIISKNDKITVTEIYVKLRIEQSVASQHLAILRRAGVVNTIRDGKYIYYSVNKDRIQQLNKLVEAFLK